MVYTYKQKINEGKMNFLNPKQIKDLMLKYGIKPKKKYGQNFLVDNNILKKIISAADIKDKVVVEIGPGIGSLTYVMAQIARYVIAVEIDKSLIAPLEDFLRDYSNVEIINQDILKLNLDDLLNERGISEYSIVANLPYYITTPIIMYLLEKNLNFDKCVFMIQKEVADRMIAVPGTKEYGALTIGVQYYCEVSLVAKVPPTVFIPKPEVTSAVVKLEKRRTPLVNSIDKNFFFQVVKAGFGKRRKTILNSLSNSDLSVTREQIVEVCSTQGVDYNKRIEQLSIEEIALIANHLKEGGSNKFYQPKQR
jgi:16S rRNA (adenine1518-N6/adenine1519-N6)-dimethyltransferase